MTTTEVHKDPLEELRKLAHQPGTNRPDPEVYNKAIANGATPERATLLAYAATNPTLDVLDKKHNDPWTERLFKKRPSKKTHKVSDGQPRPWVVFLGRTVIGAFIGLMAGAIVMFVALIVALMGWMEITNGNMFTTVLLIATTLVGAGLGYASAAKHLRSSDEEHHTTPIPKTA